jgi:SAM-dependent methyltransferase
MGDGQDLPRRTFDTVADSYHAARPDYPAQLFDDLVELAVLTPDSRLLEVGCATGKATLPLLERGFHVTCVELGAGLAAVARSRLKDLPAEIHVASFETWESEQRFDLVFAATAWHWIGPRIRYRKAHQLLRPGGHLAFWSAMHAFPVGFDPFFTEIQQVYEGIGESDQGDWPPPPPDEMYDERAAIEETGLFDQVEVRRYLWDVRYTAEEYIALLDTFSGHIAMQATKRKRLYGEIRRRFAERPDGRVRRHWCSILHVARAVATAGETRALAVPE